MLSRRWIINYFLIVLILLMTYVGNRYDVQPGFQAKPQVTDLPANEVNRIRVETHEEHFELGIIADHWWLQQPISWPANQAWVGRLINLVSQTADSSLPVKEINAADFGLQMPQVLLQLNDIEVLFGSINKIGQRRYTQIGPTVYLLPDLYLPLISQGSSAMMDHRLLPPILMLQSLTSPEFQIFRSDDGQWQQQDSKSSDQGRLKQIVTHWQNLQPLRVKPFDSKPTPKGKVLAQLQNGEQVEFFLMSINPEVIVANPKLGLQYYFNAEDYYQLFSLREPSS